MDPEPLTRAQWADAGFAIKLLWITMALMFTASQAFLAAHAIIPSAVASHHLSARWNRLRPLLYMGGFACIGGVAVALVFLIFVGRAGGGAPIHDLVRAVYPHLYR
jgi:hypothetical protein